VVTAVVVAMVSACVFVGRFIMVDVLVVHRLMGHRAVLHAKLVLQARAADWTQHGGRYRTPEGKQQGKQQQEPDANSFHYSQISTRGVTPVKGS